MSGVEIQSHGDFVNNLGHVHFVGIGGAGMCGIAEVMHNLGYVVSGSDGADTPTTRRLAGLGIKLTREHHADNVADVDVVVVSSAISPENPEWQAARQRRIPVLPRAEMLGELMRFRRGIAVAGSHGKTTTTSLIASVLAEAGLDPTFVIGGQLTAAGSNARLGSGDYLVAEADESDGSFLMLSPLIAIITNIDADHLDNYGGDFGLMRKTFADFLHRLPFYGVAVLGIDDPNVAEVARSCTRRMVTYGIDAPADVRASELRQEGARTHFLLHLPEHEPLPVTVNLPGRYNVYNTLAACAIGWQLGVPAVAMQQALADFAGIGRRFQLRGELVVDGGSVLLVDDYGHHPSELEAVFSAAREGWPERRLVVAFQPHRYTRTRDFMDDFANVLADVDVLVLTDIYPAGESPIANADGAALARAVRARGKVDPVLVDHPRDLGDALQALLRDGDLLLAAGAGDIGATVSDWVETGLVSAEDDDDN